MGFVRKLISLAIAILFFVVGTLMLLYVNYIGAVSKESKDIIVEIKQGNTSKEIGNILYEKGLI